VCFPSAPEFLRFFIKVINSSYFCNRTNNFVSIMEEHNVALM